MSYEHFLDSLTDAEPPDDVELALRALWYDANGRADSAMRAAASASDHTCKRVRAYLHRKAGDAEQATLWYYRCGAAPWTGSTQSEWEDIVHTVMADRVVASAYR